MAIEALVPESIASMRCEIGCPISMFAPDRIDSFCLTSSSNSVWLRSPNVKGASISHTLMPKACSSSSARPVLRATVRISGICMSNLSALRPIESLSSSEIPGSDEMLMVNDPSLNLGRKLLPSDANITAAITKATTVKQTAPVPRSNTQGKARR